MQNTLFLEQVPALFRLLLRSPYTPHIFFKVHSGLCVLPGAFSGLKAINYLTVSPPIPIPLPRAQY